MASISCSVPSSLSPRRTLGPAATRAAPCSPWWSAPSTQDRAFAAHDVAGVADGVAEFVSGHASLLFSDRARPLGVDLLPELGWEVNWRLIHDSATVASVLQGKCLVARWSQPSFIYYRLHQVLSAPFGKCRRGTHQGVAWLFQTILEWCLLLPIQAIS